MNKFKIPKEPLELYYELYYLRYSLVFYMKKVPQEP